MMLSSGPQYPGLSPNSHDLLLRGGLSTSDVTHQISVEHQFSQLGTYSDPQTLYQPSMEPQPQQLAAPQPVPQIQVTTRSRTEVLVNKMTVDLIRTYKHINQVMLPRFLHSRICILLFLATFYSPRGRNRNCVMI